MITLGQIVDLGWRLSSQSCTVEGGTTTRSEQKFYTTRETPNGGIWNIELKVVERGVGMAVEIYTIVSSKTDDCIQERKILYFKGSIETIEELEIVTRTTTRKQVYF